MTDGCTCGRSDETMVEGPLIVARPVGEVLSGRESTIGMSDVSRGICMEPDLLPVVMSTDDVEPLAVPVVALTRSQVERPLVVAWPVDEVLSGRESNVGMLPGRDVRG